MNQPNPSKRPPASAMGYPFPELAPRFALPEAAQGVVECLPSSTGADVRYVVNAQNVTCTCAHFERICHLFEPTDVRRVCKHLETVLNPLGAFKACDSLATAVLRAGHPKLYLLAAPLLSGQSVVFGVTPGEVWIDVYVQADGAAPYDRHGYNESKQDWAYGKWPPHLVEIRRLLRELLDS